MRKEGIRCSPLIPKGRFGMEAVPHHWEPVVSITFYHIQKTKAIALPKTPHTHARKEAIDA